MMTVPAGAGSRATSSYSVSPTRTRTASRSYSRRISASARMRSASSLLIRRPFDDRLGDSIHAAVQRHAAFGPLLEIAENDLARGQFVVAEDQRPARAVTIGEL